MQNQRDAAWERSGEKKNERHAAWESFLNFHCSDWSPKMDPPRLPKPCIFIGLGSFLDTKPARDQTEASRGTTSPRCIGTRFL